MKLKVCGMKYHDNLQKISDLLPDYLGFIFYQGSKRNMEESLSAADISQINHIEKVGVFVNKSTDFILEKANHYNFSHIQLHGDESSEQCGEVKNAGLKVIKAFSVDSSFDFSRLDIYKSHCDYFLFDAKGAGYGGNGIAFDWEVLKKYDNSLPIFLSGGIDASMAEKIAEMKWLNIHAIDINSKFEVEPGRKDPVMVSDFINKMKTYEIYG